jgi:putative acetyltransferase
MSSISSADTCLRPEDQDDLESIRRVNESAFGRTAEADLVDALREADAVTLSAVIVLEARELGDSDASAEHSCDLFTGEAYGGEVVGHVLFTPAAVMMQDSDMRLVALGPVAVLPDRQRQGLGTMMISGCLEYLRAQGHRGVVVVGDPDFYRRFGFIQASRWGLHSELEVPDEHFMALALKPGVLGGLSGAVRFRPEFGQL